MNEIDFSNFDVNELCGWHQESHQEALKTWGQNPGEYTELKIYGDSKPIPKRVSLYEVVRKVLGGDTDNYPQQIGCCGAFSGKNCIEYLTCMQIAMGQPLEFKKIYPPYLYGISRVQIGQRRVGWGDGTNGIWVAQGANQYGALSYDDEGCPPYSGNTSRKWGWSGPPDNFINIAKHHLVKSFAPVKSWDDLKSALANYYPVAVGSTIGYDMKARQDGFMHYSTTWNHLMMFFLADDGDEQVEAHAGILNNWGDCHGEIKDFRTGETWPKGTLRVHKEDALRMIAAGDCWAYSSFDGFPAQVLPESFFSQF